MKFDLKMLSLGYTNPTSKRRAPIHFWISPIQSNFALEHQMDSRSSETYARGNTGAPSRAHLMRFKE
ncbi:UNVERIFIED_CONTAM: hypothetical protein NCL1_53129 [Trichonephila clavipes]